MTRSHDCALARRWARQCTHLEIEALLESKYRAARTPAQKARYHDLVSAALLALTLKERMLVWSRYARRFGESLPMMAWDGSWAELEALMEAAIVRGAPLSAEDLWDAQGYQPPPPGADWEGERFDDAPRP
jgi:hypothetical protein